MKKKWLYLIIILLLAGPVLFFYHAFNGNPIWKVTSGHTLKDYLKDTYPQEEFNIQDGFYNFKIGGYTYDVIKLGEDGGEYEFEVTGFLNQAVTYDGIYYAHLDEPLMEKLGAEAAEELDQVLNIDELVDIAVYVEVLQGTYKFETNWNKNLKLEKPIEIHMLMDVTGMNQADVFATVQFIQKTLNEEGYAYDHVSFNGNLFDDKFGDPEGSGYVKFAVGFDHDSTISLNDIEEYN